MSRPASNRDTRPQRPKWLRRNGIQWAGRHPTRTQGHNKQCDSEKHESNELAGNHQEHKATTTNGIKKKCIQWQCAHPTHMRPMTRLASNKNIRPQRSIRLRKSASKHQAGIQQERRATTKLHQWSQAGIQQGSTATTIRRIQWPG